MSRAISWEDREHMVDAVNQQAPQIGPPSCQFYTSLTVCINSSGVRAMLDEKPYTLPSESRLAQCGDIQRRLAKLISNVDIDVWILKQVRQGFVCMPPMTAGGEMMEWRRATHYLSLFWKPTISVVNTIPFIVGRHIVYFVKIHPEIFDKELDSLHRDPDVVLTQEICPSLVSQFLGFFSINLSVSIPKDVFGLILNAGIGGSHAFVVTQVRRCTGAQEHGNTLGSTRATGVVEGSASCSISSIKNLAHCLSTNTFLKVSQEHADNVGLSGALTGMHAS
ncbi:Hypothetical protein D9617_17g047320 [Elsinoe fawcettii]|nr:Hypothetical protein D9617_17g047320 [Elsinoe fawcettii]